MENLTIKVYGSGCKGCKSLHQNVIDALAVNDKIMSAGKVLSVAEVKKYLE